jgi:hypothetical protein
VGFATSDAEGLRRYLATKGLPVPDSVKIDPDGSRSFLVHDPEGNPFEFTEHGRNSPASPSPAALGRRLSTHIMHTGYVVKDRHARPLLQRSFAISSLLAGGAKQGDIDWVMSRGRMGVIGSRTCSICRKILRVLHWLVQGHIAPGVDSVATL